MMELWQAEIRDYVNRRIRRLWELAALAESCEAQATWDARAIELLRLLYFIEHGNDPGERLVKSAPAAPLPAGPL